MQGTQYATKRSILCRGAFCGPTTLCLNGLGFKCFNIFLSITSHIYFCLIETVLLSTHNIILCCDWENKKV